MRKRSKRNKKKKPNQKKNLALKEIAIRLIATSENKINLKTLEQYFKSAFPHKIINPKI